MPVLFGKESAKEELIRHLDKEYIEIERTSKVPLGDFPDVERMRELLKSQDFTTFEKRSDRLFQQIDEVLNMDLPRLMRLVAPQPRKEVTNPFAEEPWVISVDAKKVYDGIFFSLNPQGGRISGDAARETLMNTGIGVPVLRKIWELVDFEKGGRLDADEFALALFLTEHVKQGNQLTDSLPPAFMPPSKRKPGPSGAKRTNPF